MTTENALATGAVPATTPKSAQQHPRELATRNTSKEQGKEAATRPTITKADLEKARQNSLSGGLWR